MALIACPECGQQVSTAATACPNCGCPISAVAGKNAPPQLIEQTSKQTKVLRAIGILLLLAGAVVGVTNSDGFGVKEGLPTIATAGMMLLGIAVFSAGVVSSWWHHG